MRETTHRTTHKVDAVLEEPVHQLDRQQDGEQHDKSQIKLVAEHGHGQARLCDGVPHVLVGVLLICSARVCVCVCSVHKAASWPAYLDFQWPQRSEKHLLQQAHDHDHGQEPRVHKHLVQPHTVRTATASKHTHHEAQVGLGQVHTGEVKLRCRCQRLISSNTAQKTPHCLHWRIKALAMTRAASATLTKAYDENVTRTIV